MTLDEAARRVARFVGRPVQVGTRRDGDELDAAAAIESATWWYVPYVWVGCAGYVVDKASGEVHALGSGQPLEAYLWGHDLGLRGDAIDLVVDAAPDPAAAIEVLAAVITHPTGDHRPGHRPSRDDLARALAALPARFPGQRLHHEVGALHRGVAAGALACHAEAPSPSPLQPGAWHVVFDVAAFRALAELERVRRLAADRVGDRRLEIDAGVGLRQLAIEGDLPPEPTDWPLAVDAQRRVREVRHVRVRRGKVPCRLVGPAQPVADEDAALAATFAAGGARVLITTSVHRAVAAGLEVRALDELIRYLEAPGALAPGALPGGENIIR